jgi:dienelactone hydrolase
MNAPISAPALLGALPRLFLGLPTLLLWFGATVVGLAQSVPHYFSGLTVFPDRTVTLTLDGSVSNMFSLTGTVSNQFLQLADLYVIEASTNLTEWTPLARLLRTNNDPNPLLFQDTNAAAVSQRFYRTFTNHLLTAFPQPSGPFAVGRDDRVMVDPTRTGLYRYTPKTNAFMVSFWYPADPPAAGTLPATMWDQRWAADANFILRLAAFGATGADTQWALISPRLGGHCFRSVPLTAGNAKHPVILYSHGWHATRQSASHMAEELASHGYVVVAPDHPDCWATEFPDGRYLTGSSSGDVPGRLRDMLFLLDELGRLDSNDLLFASRLDLDRVGVAGLSAGGMVVETCRSDGRVKCAAMWDATNLQLNGAGLQKPFLAALGENDLFYSENQWLFSKATTNATLLQVRGAEHVTGGDAAWTWEIPWGRGPALAFDACLIWFFDTYLKGETPPFPTNPEIYNVQRK